MSLLQKIKNNSFRIFLFFVIAFLIFGGSHILFLIVTGVALVYYKAYYEALAFGLFYDVFFSLPDSSFMGISFFYTLLFLAILLLTSFVRSLLLRS